jgi:UDP-galactopyranose mutase
MSEAAPLATGASGPDLVVAGAGPFGLTVARVLAERGRRVAVVERRAHIGGNAWSEPDQATGIEVHRYGAHIFHTANQRVWEFLSGFTEWTPYTHRVFTVHAGEVYPLPVNLATINQFFHAAFSPDEARALIADQAEAAGQGPGAADESLDAKAIRLIGRPLYEAFIRNYTAKQWQVDPALLPGSVISRLPVRHTYDSRYFSDPHQGLPRDGYAALWERLADHPRIDVRLGEDFLDGPDGSFTKSACLGQVPVVFTGPVYRYFDRVCGALGWRTLDFVWEHPDTGDFQGCAVMNYADLEPPWTRIVEFKHFHSDRDQPATKTVIAREFSRLAADDDEPYYPVNTAEDRARLERYRALAAAEPGVVFGGRLGRYQYLDMDMAVAAALTLADRL